MILRPIMVEVTPMAVSAVHRGLDSTRGLLGSLEDRIFSVTEMCLSDGESIVISELSLNIHQFIWAASISYSQSYNNKDIQILIKRDQTFCLFFCRLGLNHKCTFSCAGKCTDCDWLWDWSRRLPVWSLAKQQAACANQVSFKGSCHFWCHNQNKIWNTRSHWGCLSSATAYHFETIPRRSLREPGINHLMGTFQMFHLRCKVSVFQPPFSALLLPLIFNTVPAVQYEEKGSSKAVFRHPIGNVTGIHSVPFVQYICICSFLLCILECFL